MVIGDNRTTVHLRACASHGEHATHWNPAAVHLAPVAEIIFPRVCILICRASHSLAVVDSGSATHGKNQIHSHFLCQLYSLAHLVDGRVGHYAAQFNHLLACLLQFSLHSIVNAVALDGTASIHQHHLLAIMLQFFTQVA